MIVTSNVLPLTLFAWQFQFMQMEVYAWIFYKISGAQFMT